LAAEVDMAVIEEAIGEEEEATVVTGEVAVSAVIEEEAETEVLAAIGEVVVDLEATDEVASAARGESHAWSSRWPTRGLEFFPSHNFLYTIYTRALEVEVGAVTIELDGCIGRRFFTGSSPGDSICSALHISNLGLESRGEGKGREGKKS
jgi:hypothetical protein